ncbi:MAG: hypothetical protein V3U73_06890 [bacterium]
MKKSEKILLGVVGIAIAFFVLDTFVFSSKKRDIQAGDKKQSVSAPDSENVITELASTDQQPKAVNRDIESSMTESSTIFSGWKRDPFLGSFRPELLDSLRGNIPFVLKAISWRGDDAHVIINDEVYKMGEAKDGFLVAEVRDKQVVCVNKGVRFVLRLGE